MIILKKEQVASIPLGIEAIDILYGNSTSEVNSELLQDHSSHNKSIERLENIIKIFQHEQERFDNDFQCFIERRAFNAFVAFADEAYKSRGHEATGVIFGYYFHIKDNPQRKIIVATDFIPANGPTTAVTCTISYEDVINYNNFCEKNKMIQAVWIHSHPTYGTFYSGTDSTMLSSTFYAQHQMGVVVDNVRNQAMGFKIINGVEKHENVVLFDLDESILKNKLQTQTLYLKQIGAPKPAVKQTAPEQIDSQKHIQSEPTIVTSEVKHAKPKKKSEAEKVNSVGHTVEISHSRDCQSNITIKKKTLIDKVRNILLIISNEFSRPLSIREYVFLVIVLLSFLCYIVNLIITIWQK